MNSDLARAVIVPVLVLTLAGCASNALTEKSGDLKFGDANRQTMMAQVINPDPVYTEPAQTSGAHAADAVERYRTDTVKQPDPVSTTNSGTTQPQSN